MCAVWRWFRFSHVQYRFYFYFLVLLLDHLLVSINYVMCSDCWVSKWVPRKWHEGRRKITLHLDKELCNAKSPQSCVLQPWTSSQQSQKEVTLCHSCAPDPSHCLSSLLKCFFQKPNLSLPTITRWMLNDAETITEKNIIFCWFDKQEQKFYFALLHSQRTSKQAANICHTIIAELEKNPKNTLQYVLCHWSSSLMEKLCALQWKLFRLKVVRFARGPSLVAIATSGPLCVEVRAGGSASAADDDRPLHIIQPLLHCCVLQTFFHGKLIVYRMYLFFFFSKFLFHWFSY